MGSRYDDEDPEESEEELFMRDRFDKEQALMILPKSLQLKG